MNQVSEYLNLLKTDIPSTLSSSTDRKKTLEALINQLELRYKNAVLSSNNLTTIKNQLTAELNTIQDKIDTLKGKINGDFVAFNANASLENIQNYLDLRAQYQSDYVDIIFINQFLKQYSFLNTYNKKLLDTLINNKEALINQSFVVIPDSGDEFLKAFNLIYDEADYKALQNTAN